MYKTRCGLRLVRTMWYTAPVVPWHLVACTALLTARYMLPHDASPPDTSLTLSFTCVRTCLTMCASGLVMLSTVGESNPLPEPLGIGFATSADGPA